MSKKRRMPKEDTPVPPPEELEVQVAVFLALYEWLKRPACSVYVSVARAVSRHKSSMEDPSDDLILALYGHNIDAKPASQSEMVDGFFVDSITREPAYLLGLQHIQWNGSIGVHAKVLYLKGSRWGATFIYSLKCNGERWEVIDQTLTGMF